MKQLQIFNYQSNEIRTMEREGEPWFVLKDVCNVLGLSNPTSVADRLDADERSKFDLGRQGQGWTINESGLYAVILRSDKESAKPFRKWVTSEVLPEIRKHGEYVTPQKKQQRLGEVNSAARIITKVLADAGMAPQFVAVAMKSLYAPVGVEIPLEGITLNKRLFDATAIAKHLGVLSKTGNPHAHAVSAIIAQVDVLPKEKELAPFQNSVSGHSGTNWQYTESVVHKVRLWLERNEYPAVIYYKGKSFTVFYESKAA